MRLNKKWILYVVLLASSQLKAGMQSEADATAALRARLHTMASNTSAPKILNGPRELAWRHAQAVSPVVQRAIPDITVRMEFLTTIQYEAIRANLDPTLVLGLIKHESGLKRYAISPVGARGYMQIMPFWANGYAHILFDMRTNIMYGCTILAHYKDLEHGDMVLALGRFNGSRGQMAYPNAVLSNMRQFALNLKLKSDTLYAMQ